MFSILRLKIVGISSQWFAFATYNPFLAFKEKGLVLF